MKKLKTHHIIGTIALKTGLRIGGSDDLLQIGGTDLTCIKHPVTLQPYIPGSSLKGKMRCELERCIGKVKNEPCGCCDTGCMVCRVFGPHKKPKHSLGPTRILVRDANCVERGEIETKTENIIDRQGGAANNFWKIERVVPGSRFSLEIVLQEWDLDKSCSFNNKTGGEALIEFVKDGLREVRNTGLGSGVSRGSGQVDFEDMKVDGEVFAL
jgi:CRISPR-associated protein Csm3